MDPAKEGLSVGGLGGGSLVGRSGLAVPHARRGVAAAAAPVPAPASGEYNAYNPDPAGGPVLRYSPSTGKMFVNGAMFDKTDAQAALDSTANLRAAPAPLPNTPVTDWVKVSLDEYASFIDSIENPSRGTLFRKNFKLGVGNLVKSAGSTLEMVGAEKLGKAVSDYAQENIDQLQPYTRRVLDIASVGDAGDYAVATIGQQLPNLLDLAATALAAFASGGTAAGARASAALAGAAGKKELASAVAAAAAKKRAGVALTATEIRDLRRGRALLAAGAAAAENMRLNSAEIYNEIKDTLPEGATPDGFQTLVALGGGAVAAGLDFTPEYLLAKAVLTGAGKAAKSTARSALRRKASDVTRTAGKFAGLEAATEASQEMVGAAAAYAATGVEPEKVDILIRAVEAGAAGGLLGGLGGGIAGLSPATPASGKAARVDTSRISAKPGGGTDTAGAADTARAAEKAEVAERLKSSEPVEIAIGVDTTASTGEVSGREVLQIAKEQREASVAKAVERAEKKARKAAEKYADVLADLETNKSVNERPKLVKVGKAAKELKEKSEALARALEKAGVTDEEKRDIALRAAKPVLDRKENIKPPTATAGEASPQQAGNAQTPPVVLDVDTTPSRGETILQLDNARPAGQQPAVPAGPRADKLAAFIQLPDNQRVGGGLQEIGEDAMAMVASVAAAVESRASKLRQMAEEVERAPNDKVRTQRAAALEGAIRNFKSARGDELFTIDRARVFLANVKDGDISSDLRKALEAEVGRVSQAFESLKRAMSELNEFYEIPPEVTDTNPLAAEARVFRSPLAKVESKDTVVKEVLTLTTSVSNETDPVVFSAGVSALMDIMAIGRGTPEHREVDALGGRSPVSFAEDAVTRMLSENYDATREAIHRWALQQESLTATYNDKTLRASMRMVLKAGLMGQLRVDAKRKPDGWLPRLGKDADLASEAAIEIEQLASWSRDAGPAARLAAAIDQIAMSEDPKRSYTVRVRDMLRKAVSEVVKSGNDILATYKYRDGVLADYIGRGGELAFARGDDGRSFIVKRGSDGAGRFMLRDFDAPNQNLLARPISHTAVISGVKRFMRKVKARHDVHVVSSLADLKENHASLYQKAAAARPFDFDKRARTASGYSFGRTTIIFSDNIRTQQHLDLVLAHEIIGHYGFRAVVPSGALNVALDSIYENNANVQRAVDEIMASRSLGRREATEEYVADMAAAIDNSVILRLWFAIKDALNKLGVKFSDDAARYWIGQARAYVRNGDAGLVMFHPSEFARRLHKMNTEDTQAGRFADVGETGFIAGQLPWMDSRSADVNKIGNVISSLRATGVNTADLAERLLSEFKTLNFAARENFGTREMFRILRSTSQRVNTLRSKYQKIMRSVFNPAFEVAGVKLGGQATKQSLRVANEMLVATSLAKHNAWNKSQLEAVGPLIKVEDGGIVINNKAVAQLKRMGRFTIEEFRRGAEYEINNPRPMTDEDRQRIEAERDKAVDDALNRGASNEEIAAIRDPYDEQLKAGIVYDTIKKKLKPMPDLTESSMEWIVYNQVRDAVDESQLDTLMANYAVAKGERERLIKSAEGALKVSLSSRDKKLLAMIADKYSELRKKGAAYNAGGLPVFSEASLNEANDFVGSFNRAMLGGDADSFAQHVTSFFEPDQQQFVKDAINALRDKANIRGGNKFLLQHTVLNISMAQISASEGDLSTRRSIASGYVPFDREGEGWQVRMKVVDESGKPLRVADEFQSVLPYYQFSSRARAQDIADRVAELFDTSGTAANGEGSGGFFDIRVIHEVSSEKGQRSVEYRTVKARIVPVVETAQTQSADPGGFDVHEFVRVASQYGIMIPPEARERLVVGLTRQDAAIRHGLQRETVPGFSMDAIKASRRHLEAASASIAKREHRHLLTMLFDDNIKESQDLWFGSSEEYRRRKQEYKRLSADPDAPREKVFIAKRKFDEYHFFYKKHEAPVMGNRYRDRALREIAWLESQKSVQFSDFGSGDLASRIKMWTTMAQLGGSIATGTLNWVSIGLNALPTLAGYNPKTSFGGGYGFGPTSQALVSAFRHVIDPRMSDPAFYETKAFREKAKHNLTPDEVRFLRNETASGIFQAAQQTSLIGSARGNINSAAMQHVVRLWMYPFSYTEESSRRAVGLAAYRLERDRQIRAGVEEKLAEDRAAEAARTLVENSLGEYAMFNRPAMFRGGLQQFLFIYKMFVVTSIQMMSALPPRYRAGMAMALISSAGLSGLPFAKDLMDIATLIMQRLGMKNPIVEKNIVTLGDKIFPGFGRFLLEGGLNGMMPASIGPRLSLGDVIPGTSLGIAGNDTGRSLLEIGGPAASLLAGTVSSASQIVRYAAGKAGIAPQTTSLQSIMRDSPVTMMRALGDTMAYTQTGAVLDSKGYVVTPDLTAGIVVSRILGFYPSAAAHQNSVIRMSYLTSSYQNDVARGFVLAYVKAKLSYDAAAVRRINKAVREWNEATRGTSMRINNFWGRANKALRAAKMTAVERRLKSVPRAQRGELRDLIYAMGA